MTTTPTPDSDAAHLERCHLIAEHLQRVGAHRLPAVPVRARGRGPDKRQRKAGSGVRAAKVGRTASLPAVVPACREALRTLAAQQGTSIAQVIEDLASPITSGNTPI